MAVRSSWRHKNVRIYLMILRRGCCHHAGTIVGGLPMLTIGIEWRNLLDGCSIVDSSPWMPWGGILPAFAANQRLFRLWQFRRRFREKAGDGPLQSFRWRGWSCLYPPKFQKYLIKYKFLQFFHCSYILSARGRRSKTWRILIASFHRLNYAFQKQTTIESVLAVVLPMPEASLLPVALLLFVQRHWKHLIRSRLICPI